jgi:hypothetical protein
MHIQQIINSLFGENDYVCVCVCILIGLCVDLIKFINTTVASVLFTCMCVEASKYIYSPADDDVSLRSMATKCMQEQ